MFSFVLGIFLLCGFSYFLAKYIIPRILKYLKKRSRLAEINEKYEKARKTREELLVFFPNKTLFS